MFKMKSDSYFIFFPSPHLSFSPEGRGSGGGAFVVYGGKWYWQW